ncbi:alpha/beta hydrolase fold domain-containing protein [Paeniglutamicibacter cryotolerans]|uniref:Acetyl esterase/lipase n=1 Tax=Paeniglutamicibacter cryotolerans TaxID=670079 RepID=A0A839QRH6_9MICC|nr:alpha/beta hydrolase [Paeniglutamicibacter cryotolerans]MBB2994671.1 acetyl esterase/lipase [Paeniglutamicibacter cryotolerans]
MSMHSAFREYLDGLNPLVEQAARDGFVPTPESARAALVGLSAFVLPSVADARVFDAVVGGADAVPVRVYVPRPESPSDVILFVHGGGHRPETSRSMIPPHGARRTAAATGMVVVSVDYRRSPEALFPEGLGDVYRALRDLDVVLGNVETTGKIQAVADSGGAAKVESIAMPVAAGQWSSPIDRQLLLYPSVDYTMGGESLREFATGYFLSAERVKWYFDNYFPAGADRAAASPLSGPFAPEMPETLVIAVEYDPLLTKAVEYVERMRAAGARAHLVIAPGMLHAFAFSEDKVPEAISRLYALIAEFLTDGGAPAGW